MSAISSSIDSARCGTLLTVTDFPRDVALSRSAAIAFLGAVEDPSFGRLAEPHTIVMSLRFGVVVGPPVFRPIVR